TFTAETTPFEENRGEVTITVKNTGTARGTLNVKLLCPTLQLDVTQETFQDLSPNITMKAVFPIEAPVNEEPNQLHECSYEIEVINLKPLWSTEGKKGVCVNNKLAIHSYHGRFV